jgi:hypothetical protein
MPEIDDHIFFSSASYYYVAGRFAVFARFNPVAANLIHHAVEMYLKGALLKSKAKTLKELKQLGHSLPNCWKAFKAQTNDPALNKFDGVVDAIHKYEELRYPDQNSKGMSSTFNIVRWTPPSLPGTPASTVPSYELCLPDVDELIAAIIAAASINPEVYLCFPSQEGNEYVVRENGEATLTKQAASVLTAVWAKTTTTTPGTPEMDGSS